MGKLTAWAALVTRVQAVHGKSSTAARGLSKAPPPDTVLADLILGVCEGTAGDSAQTQFLSLLLLLCRLIHMCSSGVQERDGACGEERSTASGDSPAAQALCAQLCNHGRQHGKEGGY